MPLRRLPHRCCGKPTTQKFSGLKNFNLDDRTTFADVQFRGTNVIAPLRVRSRAHVLYLYRGELDAYSLMVYHNSKEAEYFAFERDSADRKLFIVQIWIFRSQRPQHQWGNGNLDRCHRSAPRSIRG